MLDRSNSLTVLAAQIRAEHEAAADSLKSSVEHAIAAGALLLEAKGQVPHGQWLPWLKDNCAISERTAQLYMRCAKNSDDIKEQMGGEDLTLNEAAAMLALSSDVRKLFDFVKELEGISDPEQVMQACLRSGAAIYGGTNDYHSGYTDEQNREWLLFILFMVRHVRWPTEYADDHCCWLKRRGYETPSEWMGEEGDKDRHRWRDWLGGPMSETLKQCWKDLLAQTAGLDEEAINKVIAKEDKALRAEIEAAPRRRQRRRQKRNALRI